MHLFQRTRTFTRHTFKNNFKKMKLEKLQSGINQVQSDEKQNEGLTLNYESPQNKLNMNDEETEETSIETTFQRRPQFRINENNKRRFS